MRCALATLSSCRPHCHRPRNTQASAKTVATANHVSQRRDVTTLSTRRRYRPTLGGMKSQPIASVPAAGMPDTFGRVATDLGLGHGPLQPALLVLHASRGPAVDAQVGDAYR